jgi:hypothetical protein
MLIGVYSMGGLEFQHASPSGHEAAVAFVPGIRAGGRLAHKGRMMGLAKIMIRIEHRCLPYRKNETQGSSVVHTRMLSQFGPGLGNFLLTCHGLALFVLRGSYLHE